MDNMINENNVNETNVNEASVNETSINENSPKDNGKGKKNFINKKSLKYGANSFILIAVAVAIAVVVNMLVGYGDIKWDLTQNKMYSIGDTTKDILKGLNKDVEIYGLFDDTKAEGNDGFKQVKEVLNQYTKESGKVKVSFIDPDKQPGFVKEKIDPNGLVKDLKAGDFVVKSGSKIKKVTGTDIFQTQYSQTGQPESSYFIGEQSFTGAIKYVTSEKTPTVYFTEGHKEGTLDSEYTVLKKQLEINNYDVKSINLMLQAKVPENAEILMVLSPQADLAVSEKDVIKEFLNNGGKVVFMFDYIELNPKFTQVEDILKDYNLSLNYDKVRENDQNRHYPGNPYAIAVDVKKNQINPLDSTLLLANSRSINVLKDQKEGLTVTSLMKTSDKAVGEQVDKAAGSEIPGPLDLAVAAESNKGGKNSKVIVMGNGFFVNDSAYQVYGPYYENGMSFFLGSLNWMMDSKDNVVIPPKTVEAQVIDITEQQSNITLALTLGLLPLTILGAGMFIWMRRRHL
ncbi:MAG: GldG family protein [Clostridia bacterium]|nr:GldG family protein [Clostridia bacterium]